MKKGVKLLHPRLLQASKMFSFPSPSYMNTKTHTNGLRILKNGIGLARVEYGNGG